MSDDENRKRSRVDPLSALESALDASPSHAGMGMASGMISGSSMILKEVVLVGGGHAHVHVIKMFGMKPISGVRVTLITRDVLTPYSGMLPGHIASFYSSDECHIDLIKLTSFAQVRLIHCEAVGLDVHQKLVNLKGNRPSIRYDILSLDIGSCPRPLSTAFTLSDVTPVIAVKPIDSFSNRWETSLKCILESQPSSSQHVVVVGGGAGGVELTFAIHCRLQDEFRRRSRDFSKVTITLITRGSHILSSHNK